LFLAIKYNRKGRIAAILPGRKLGGSP
jgi:hypothetical protein